MNHAEITITKGKRKITIKGHSLPEEKTLLELFAPELISINIGKEINSKGKTKKS